MDKESIALESLPSKLLPSYIASNANVQSSRSFIDRSIVG